MYIIAVLKGVTTEVFSLSDDESARNLLKMRVLAVDGSKNSSIRQREEHTADPGYGRGVPFGAVNLSGLGSLARVTPLILCDLTFSLLFYTDEIDPQCKGNLSCSILTA